VHNGTNSIKSLCSKDVFTVKSYHTSDCRGLHDSTQYPTGSCIKTLVGNYVKYEC
jgi:hypothetical protein